MTTATENPMDVLAALLGERARYEAWLGQLETRRATTPQHVFDRVRADYGARLAKVTEQLAGRAGELQATATDLAARVAALFDEETQRRDERAEAELRASVGEYAGDEAQTIIERCDAEIARLEGERATVGAELAKVQDILNQVTAPPPAPAAPMASSAPEVTAASAPAPHATAVDPAAAQAAAEAPARGTTPPSPFDDLAFLQTLVQPQGAKGAAPAPAPSAAPSPASAARPGAPESDEAEGATAPAAPTAAAPPRAAVPATATAGGRSAGESLLQPSLTPGTLPAFLKDMPTEQIKTLKCQECGTMNYPTEWYCERCGGELAAL